LFVSWFFFFGILSRSTPLDVLRLGQFVAGVRGSISRDSIDTTNAEDTLAAMAIDVEAAAAAAAEMTANDEKAKTDDAQELPNDEKRLSVASAEGARVKFRRSSTDVSNVSTHSIGSDREGNDSDQVFISVFIISYLTSFFSSTGSHPRHGPRTGGGAQFATHPATAHCCQCRHCKGPAAGPRKAT
jgi:hypothetical protein